MSKRHALRRPVCYLLCFDRPVCAGARHYLGYSTHLEARLGAHARGRGSVLTRALVRARGAFTCVRVWPDGTQALERRLKRSGPARLCPACSAKQ